MKQDQDILAPLTKIKAVDAPPFLFTRIQSRIASQGIPEFTKAQLISILSAAIIILAVNSVLIRTGNSSSESSAYSMPSNQLYYE